VDLLYLDYNCFQRGFDDPQQIRIQMEALACQEIFVRAEGVVCSWSGLLERVLKVSLPALKGLNSIARGIAAGLEVS
jgi:hypothetical protein